MTEQSGNFRKLKRVEMKNVTGGMEYWCRRLSDNVIYPDGSPVGPEFVEYNSHGCYIYEGMPPNAHPDCRPSSPNFLVMQNWGVPC